MFTNAIALLQDIQIVNTKTLIKIQPDSYHQTAGNKNRCSYLDYLALCCLLHR